MNIEKEHLNELWFHSEMNSDCVKWCEICESSWICEQFATRNKKIFAKMIFWKQRQNSENHQRRFIKRIETLMTDTTTYSFKQIWDTIFSSLQELATWNDARVWAVYNHDIKIENWISLPAIVITPSNWAVSLLDSCSYENQINYTVRLFDRTQSNYSDIEDNMRVVADLVLKKLKQIWTIAWNDSDWKTVKCEFDYERWFTDTQEPFRVFEITCRFTSIEK